MLLRAPVAAAVLLVALPAAAANDPAAAREQLKLGYNLAQDGKCEEAIPHLVESLRLDPKAITLINLADCEERVHKLTDALGHWVDARGRAQAEGMKAIEEEATDRAKALEPKLPRLTISLAAGAPDGTTVDRDGVALGAPSLGVSLPLDPGPHVLVVHAQGHDDARTDVLLAEGEARAVTVTVGAVRAAAPVAVAAPAPVVEARRGTSPLVWAGFGVAAVGVALGAVTGAKALSAGSDADTACPNHRCGSQSNLDDVESGRHFATVSTVSFIVAGVGAAVGLYGLFLARPPKRAAWDMDPFALRGRF